MFNPPQKHLFFTGKYLLRCSERLFSLIWLGQHTYVRDKIYLNICSLWCGRRVLAERGTYVLSRFANKRSFFYPFLRTYIRLWEQVYGIACKVLYWLIQRFLLSYGISYHFAIIIAYRGNFMACSTISAVSNTVTIHNDYW